MAGLQSFFPRPDRSSFARRVERRLRDQGIVGPIEFDSGAFARRRARLGASPLRGATMFLNTRTLGAILRMTMLPSGVGPSEHRGNAEADHVEPFLGQRFGTSRGRQSFCG